MIVFDITDFSLTADCTGNFLKMEYDFKVNPPIKRYIIFKQQFILSLVKWLPRDASNYNTHETCHGAHAQVVFKKQNDGF